MGSGKCVPVCLCAMEAFGGSCSRFFCLLVNGCCLIVKERHWDMHIDQMNTKYVCKSVEYTVYPLCSAYVWLDKRKVSFSRRQISSQPQYFWAWVSNLDLQKVGMHASISSLPSQPPFTSFLSHPPRFILELEKGFSSLHFYHLQGNTVWISVGKRQLANRRRQREESSVKSNGSWGEQSLCVYVCVFFCFFAEDTVGGTRRS